jgi:hypothetical protein
MTPMRKRPRTVTIPELFPPVFSSFTRALRSGFQAALLAILLLCLCPGMAKNAWAQPVPAGKKAGKQYALIVGTVWGPGGLPMYGVKVRIHQVGDRKGHWELYSDHQGEFALRVPAGRADYVVGADLKGYKFDGGVALSLDQEVAVHVENDERVDIGLHLKR